jgi:hypothetical protein
LVPCAGLLVQPARAAACGRGLETTIVDGRIVLRDGRMTTIDESALRAEIAVLMPALLRDVAQVRAARLQGRVP